MQTKLQHFFSNYSLTKSQSELIEKMEKFLSDSDKNVFLLNGYAGTGKTFIVSQILHYIGKIHSEIFTAVPTWKAAMV